MKRPNYTKMRIKLNKGVSKSMQEDYNKLSDDDILYEYIKVYGQHLVPKEDVWNWPKNSK